MNNRKYILILSAVVIIFHILYNSFIIKTYQFNMTDEYIFADKKASEVLKDCKRIYDQLGNEGEILDILKFIQLTEYLLYEDNIDSGTYYDLMMTISSVENTGNQGHKQDYRIEMDQYLNRKRKTKIKYIKYEASEVIFYSQGDTKYAYVVAKTYWDSGIQYLKYDFVYEGGVWHLKKITSIDKVKEKG